MKMILKLIAAVAMLTVLGCSYSLKCPPEMSEIGFIRPDMLEASYVSQCPTLQRASFRQVDDAEVRDIRLCRSPYALASPHFHYNEYKAQTQDVGLYVTSWLYNTFGNGFLHVDEELQRPNVAGVETVLWNTTCVRNHNCGPYETLHDYTVESLAKAIRADEPKLKAALIKDAQTVSDWLKGHLPGSKHCWVNPFLEHNLDGATWSKAVGWIEPVFRGQCTIVWNPVGGSPGPARAPAAVAEGHGDAPRFAGGLCIANPDGTAIGASGYPAYLAKYGQRCDFACAWDGEVDNCRPAGDPFRDPRSRPCDKTGGFKRMRDAMIGARKLAVSIPAWSAEDEKGKAGCAKFLDVSDGAKKGFLWKQSDPAVLNRGAVTFLPTAYNGKRIDFSKVYVTKGSVRISTAYERGVYHEDGSDRQFYRFHKPAVDFPFNVVAHYGNLCAVLVNPKMRND
jgi:hypothetical protein